MMLVVGNYFKGELGELLGDVIFLSVFFPGPVVSFGAASPMLGHRIQWGPDRSELLFTRRHDHRVLNLSR